MVCIRNLGPQALDTLTATITHMKGNHLAALGIHGDPNPLLIRLFLDEAAHFIRFHLKPLYHHITVIGDGLDMEMIRQCLEALDQETQERLEFDTHRTTDAAQRDPLHKQAFNQCLCVIRDEIWLKAFDKLATTAVALMILFAVVNVTIFLILGRLTPWTHVSNDHGFLLTSILLVDVFSVNSSMDSIGEHYMERTTS
jgi:hypothetical protein